MAEVLATVIGIAGFALVVAGLHMAWAPLGLIGGGCLLVLVALAFDRDEVEA